MVHRKKYHKALWSTLPLKHLDELNILADVMDNHLGLPVNNNTTLDLNIVSYFINILASPDELTWNTIDGPITKAKNYLGLTKHH